MSIVLVIVFSGARTQRVLAGALSWAQRTASLRFAAAGPGANAGAALAYRWR